MKQPPKKLERKTPPLTESEIDKILQPDKKQKPSSQNSTQTEKTPPPNLVRLRLQDELEQDNLRKAFGHLSLAKNISKAR